MSDENGVPTAPPALPTLNEIAAQHAQDAALFIDCLDLPVGAPVSESYTVRGVRVVVQIVPPAPALQLLRVPTPLSFLAQFTPAMQEIIRECDLNERVTVKTICKRVRKGKSAVYDQLAKLVVMEVFRKENGQYFRVMFAPKEGGGAARTN
jgi:hypothetical protein